MNSWANLLATGFIYNYYKLFQHRIILGIKQYNSQKPRNEPH